MKVDIDIMNLNDALLIEPFFSEKFDKFWSIDILKSDLLNENSKYIIAKSNNEIVGFAGMKVILDEADIMNIVVKVDKRGLGIGSLLLEKLIQSANDFNCSQITLEVNENNIQAIKLYEKYGFMRIGFRKKYYNNTDNAILMKRDLGGTNEK